MVKVPVLIDINELKRFIYTMEKVFRIRIYTVVYDTIHNGKVQCPYIAKRPTKVKKVFSIKGMNRWGWTTATYMNHNVIELA